MKIGDRVQAGEYSDVAGRIGTIIKEEVEYETGLDLPVFVVLWDATEEFDSYVSDMGGHRLKPIRIK